MATRRGKPLRLTKRRIVELGLRDPSFGRDQRIRDVILSIPRGKVATYSQVAAAAGYPLYHRQVVRLLRQSGDSLPWQRVVGAGGFIKLHLDAGLEQRLRLEMEGVKFLGKRIDMAAHAHTFPTWEL